jgi:hypothetical protein
MCLSFQSLWKERVLGEGPIFLVVDAAHHVNDQKQETLECLLAHVDTKVEETESARPNKTVLTWITFNTGKRLLYHAFVCCFDFSDKTIVTSCICVLL